MRFVHALPLLALWAVAPPLSAQVTPGQWENVTTMHTMEMPGMPPEMAAMMRKHRPQEMRTTHCLTPEEARRGPQDMLQQQKSCRYDEYSMQNGKIRARMHCNEKGMKGTVKMDGSYTPTSYLMDIEMTMTGERAMHMKSTSKGRRIGQCPIKK